jgi:tRNA(His) guanylyltransferase
MSHDDLGDRMKMYEGLHCSQRFIPLLPIVARIDGRAFHTFTRGMDRPFDQRLHGAMVATAEHLAKETNANLVYTQSDEISLVWHSTSIKSQIWFDGRVCKMTSQLAAQATLAFYRAILVSMPEYADRMPSFDARVWQLPTRGEVANMFIWREQDATRNSISMAASTVYSDKELFGKNSKEQQEMLFQKGINWNDYPDAFKRGVYVQRVTKAVPFTTEEIETLPPSHEARSNPDLLVARRFYETKTLPIFASIVNREAVIFDGIFPLVDIYDI